MHDEYVPLFLSLRLRDVISAVEISGSSEAEAFGRTCCRVSYNIHLLCAAGGSNGETTTKLMMVHNHVFVSS